MAKYQGRRGVQGNFRGKVEGVQQNLHLMNLPEIKKVHVKENDVFHVKELTS